MDLVHHELLEIVQMNFAIIIFFVNVHNTNIRLCGFVLVQKV